ncbi:MAG: UDP-N-acetylglucosamine 2-epimerase [Flavobacteriales bacterium]|jgi:GDP/UDP-N,N'-diacetylbacillosamine 2-epimerase (hydrolysing)|nr:UDP-N-acetylglucosamine 2-epimerase [Flavobacteriales bacterium]
MKCCVITGTRAEYGLFYWLMKGIEQSENLNLQIIATGMHLSPEFGMTVGEIEKDFKVDRKIEMLLSSDTPTGISKSMGLAQISFAEAFEQLSPDLVIVLGDRYEIFSAVSAALVARIPVAHIHGGETSEGATDEAMRHSITKMSHLHFTAAEAYRKRVVQLGEHPDRVFQVGGLGIDNILKLPLMNKKDLEQSLDIKLEEQVFLITFHPVTLENSTSKAQTLELLKALDSFPDATLIFTKANSDADGRVINQLIDNYCLQRSNAHAYFSLGQTRYLSMIKESSVVIGNSSSGLIEVPSFNKPTVNIGDRQKGRLKAESVIDCLPEKKEITTAINKALSENFSVYISETKNPYGNGGSSEKIIEILEQISLEDILKKKFYDLKNI